MFSNLAIYLVIIHPLCRKYLSDNLPISSAATKMLRTAVCLGLLRNRGHNQSLSDPMCISNLIWNDSQLGLVVVRGRFYPLICLVLGIFLFLGIPVFRCVKESRAPSVTCSVGWSVDLSIIFVFFSFA